MFEVTDSVLNIESIPSNISYKSFKVQNVQKVFKNLEFTAIGFTPSALLFLAEIAYYYVVENVPKNSFFTIE
jgi:hypothetical protein